MTAETTMHGPPVQGVAIGKNLRLLQADRLITCTSPMTDFHYKQVILCLHALETRKKEIGKDFCDTTWKIIMPGVPLSVHSPEYMSEHVDAPFQKCALAIKIFITVQEQ
jgi:hypothetical protein